VCCSSTLASGGPEEAEGLQLAREPRATSSPAGRCWAKLDGKVGEKLDAKWRQKLEKTGRQVDASGGTMVKRAIG